MGVSRRSGAGTGLAPAVALFHSLSDATRLAIVQRLAGGESRVVDLVAGLGLAQSTVSAHVACLRDCGLVVGRPEGRQVFYSPGPTGAVGSAGRGGDTAGRHRERGGAVPDLRRRAGPIDAPKEAADERRVRVRRRRAPGRRGRRRGTGAGTAVGGQRAAVRRGVRGVPAGGADRRLGWRRRGRWCWRWRLLALLVGAYTFVPSTVRRLVQGPDRCRHADDHRRGRRGHPRRGRRGRDAGVPVLHQRGPGGVLRWPAPAAGCGHCCRWCPIRPPSCATACEMVVAPAELRVGDRMLVKPGERIATDGIIRDGPHRAGRLGDHR